MDFLQDFLSWAWARHHNPLSWYIRPLFVLPFCWFAYRRSTRGLVLTIVAVLTSMFWFPAPEHPSARATEFLAMERQYATGDWTFLKVAMTALVPAWFFALGWAFWHRSWWGGVAVFNGGALLKVLWGFYFGGGSAWSIIPPVLVGAVVVNSLIWYAYRRVHQRGTRPADPVLH